VVNSAGINSGYPSYLKNSASSTYFPSLAVLNASVRAGITLNVDTAEDPPVLNDILTVLAVPAPPPAVVSYGAVGKV